MNKSYLLIVLALCSFMFKLGAQSIIQVGPEEYGRLKSSNQLVKGAKYVVTPAPNFVEKYVPSVPNPNAPAQVMSGSCNCVVPLDASFSVVPMGAGSPPDYRNDDGSSSVIPLNFNFCFYGTTYSDCYINNNGNITFLSAQSSFSSTGFPNNTDVMVAPFWADVDTQDPASGLVHYKQGPNYLIVKWEEVGYYSSMADKKNTFQLIISDGADTLDLGTDTIYMEGKNVAFCYGDMQWTTGSASSGTGGFGGIAATAGVNKGDGTNWIQIGRFDQAGAAYDGPYGASDGISWLDNKSFSFDACGSAGNLPPLSISSFGGECNTDTVKMCSFQDTLILEAVFTAPEQNQSITFSSSAPSLGTNFQLFSSSGVAGTDTVRFIIIGSAAVVGTHLVSITATDNGTPALATTLNYIIEVPNINLPQPIISSTPSPICAGGAGSTLTLDNCADYTSIVWSDGSTGCSATYPVSGQEFVTVIAPNGCTRSSVRDVVISPNPIPTITGPLNYCGAAGTNLGVSVTGSSQPITTYAWNVPGSGNQSTVFVDSAYTVTLTVTDANGCTGSTNATVSNSAPVVTISSNNSTYCAGVQLVLTASIPGGTYTWAGPNAPYPATQSITDTPPLGTTVPYNYTVTVMVNGCPSTASISIPTNPLQVTAIAPEYCLGETPSITASVTQPGTYNFVWQPGGLTGATITPAGPNITYTVTTSIAGSCPDTYTITSLAGPNPLPSAVIDTYSPGNTAAGNTIICNKQTKVLTANYGIGVDTTGYNYSWSPISGSQQDSSAVLVNAAGTYYLMVTDTNGCVQRDTFEIVMVTPSIQLTYTPFICREDTALVVINGTSTTPFDISVMSGVNVISTNDSVLVHQNGVYPVTITDQNGCKATSNITLSYYPKPNANFIDEPDSVSEYLVPVLYINTSTITGGSITGYSWQFGDGSGATGIGPQIHDYVAPGNYPVTLIVTSNKGCLDTVVYNHLVEVHLPLVNIITPDNGDDINGKLEFRGLQFFSENKIVIFNRWGKKVYEKDNYMNDWDGDGLEAGTYYYILEVKGHRPESVLSSFLQIIR